MGVPGIGNGHQERQARKDTSKSVAWKDTGGESQEWRRNAENERTSVDPAFEMVPSEGDQALFNVALFNPRLTTFLDILIPFKINSYWSMPILLVLSCGPISLFREFSRQEY